MSFWKSVGDLAMKAGSAVATEAKAAGQRSSEYKEQMQGESDSSLKSIMVRDFKHSPLKASSARRELLNRGYSEDELRSHMQMNR